MIVQTNPILYGFHDWDNEKILLFVNKNIERRTYFQMIKLTRPNIDHSIKIKFQNKQYLCREGEDSVMVITLAFGSRRQNN